MAMNVPYRRLRERAVDLGSHFKKHLLVLDRYLPGFLDSLEKNRVRERIDLWRPATDPRAGMALIRDISRSPKEELQFVRAYYSIQFMLLDIVNLDTLKLSLASGQERQVAHHQFLMSLGKAFVRLSTAYLEYLIRYFVPASRELRWALIGVGTLRDQDDIDVVLIDDGSPARARFNVEFSRVYNEMLKSATPLHFYLAEHMGHATYSYTLEDYSSLAERRLDDHVVMSEIVNATYLLGSRGLSEAFQAQIADRYFEARSSERIYHDVFLRGMTGEVRSLLLRRLPGDLLHPKNDGLRIIKGLAHVFKTIDDVRSRSPWKVLDYVGGARQKQRHNFRRLKRSLSFFETVQTAYQILYAQDEEIFVEEGGEGLAMVADALGYRPLGVLTPQQQFLVEYYEHVSETRAAARALVGNVHRHLRTFSSFHDLFREDDERPRSALARSLIDEFRRRPGNRYWYDVLERFEGDGRALLQGIADSFHGYDDAEQAKLVEDYTDWGRLNVFSWMTFNRMLDAEPGGRNTPVSSMRRRMNLALLRVESTEAM